MRLLSVSLALGVIALAGCSTVGPVSTGTEPPTAAVDRDAMIADLDTAVRVVDGFWVDHWSDFFTGTYISPTVVGLYDGTDEAEAPTCDGRALRADNAFYCPQEDFVAWDVGIVSAGYAIGDAWAYLVVAHEWGHAIQSRLGLSTDSEIQADCLAGAVLFGAAADGALGFDDSDQAEISAGFDALSGKSAHTGHREPLERIEAFDLGHQRGVLACLPAG